jgi:hypothetical protein
VRLSEQLAAVMAELRQATEANRQRQELNSQVGPDGDGQRGFCGVGKRLSACACSE